MHLLGRRSHRDPCEFQDVLGDILRKTEVSFVPLSCSELGPTEILVSLSFFYSEILVRGF